MQVSGFMDSAREFGNTVNHRHAVDVFLLRAEVSSTAAGEAGSRQTHLSSKPGPVQRKV